MGQFRALSLGTKIKSVFNRKNIIVISIFALLSKSMYLTWIFWDAIISIRLYKHQSVKEHILRFVRLFVGLGWFVGIINPLTAGVTLIVDGLFSIFRYRFKNVTKDFIEDVPRLVRILIGLSLIYAFPGFLL